jgi:pyruvate/2-oxoglutarate dehydrogenase complex dihydrolipoamide acyltransferase (E2) component
MSKKNKKKWGDRKDGKKIKVPAMAKVMTYLKSREEAYVYINRKFDVTDLVKYMKKKKEKNPDITYFHAFSTAIAKTIYNRPRLNTFIMNHNFYQRNDVILTFTARISYDDNNNKEIMSLIKVDPNDNIDSLSNKIKEKVNNFRNKKIQSSSDDSLDLLGKLPNWMLKIFVAPIAKWMDRHDLLPRSLYDELLYNSSVILSNLGSIRCGAIHHNLTNFGTNSIILTIGDIHKEQVVMPNGKVEIRDIVEFGINLDERIGDGVYFSKAVNLLDYIMTHPETLEDKANEIIEEKENFKY